MTNYLLRLTEANHGENEFFELGGAGFSTEAERAASIAGIPRDLGDHDCQTALCCYLVDVLSPEDDFSITDSFEVTEAIAHELLGVEDFEPLRARERGLLAAVANAAID